MLYPWAHMYIHMQSRQRKKKTAYTRSLCVRRKNNRRPPPPNPIWQKYTEAETYKKNTYVRLPYRSGGMHSKIAAAVNSVAAGTPVPEAPPLILHHMINIPQHRHMSASIFFFRTLPDLDSVLPTTASLSISSFAMAAAPPGASDCSPPDP